MDKKHIELLIKVDSYLSLLRHRGNIKWGSIGMCESYEVDRVIGELRKEIEIIKKPTPEQWAKWYAHKSNREICIENEERIKDEKEMEAEEKDNK